MAVVIQNATKGIIFGYDGNDCKIRMLNMEAHFKHKPFNVKLLDNKGVDIVASGNAFVSDIVFKDSNRKDLNDFYKIKRDHFLLSPKFYEEKNNYDSYLKRLQAIYKRNRELRWRLLGRDVPTYDWYNFNDWFQNRRITTVDYYDPVNWTLTYKMRGFTDLHSTSYPKDHTLIDSITAFAIYFNLKVEREVLEEEDSYDDEEEEEEEESAYEVDEESESEDDYKSEADEETEDLQDVTDIEKQDHYLGDIDSKTWMLHYFGREYPLNEADKWRGIYDNDSNSSDKSYSWYSHSRSHIPEYLSNLKKKPKGLTPDHLMALKEITHQCLYVEYGPTPDCIEVKERHVPVLLQNRSKVLDLYEQGSSEPYGTVIDISMAPPLTDYEIHSDEGFYDAGVNYYSKDQGIVLTGEQNAPTMFYGMAVEEDYFIPDIFYEKINV